MSLVVNQNCGLSKRSKNGLAFATKLGAPAPTPECTVFPCSARRRPCRSSIPCIPGKREGSESACPLGPEECWRERKVFGEAPAPDARRTSWIGVSTRCSIAVRGPFPPVCCQVWRFPRKACTVAMVLLMDELALSKLGVPNIYAASLPWEYCAVVLVLGCKGLVAEPSAPLPSRNRCELNQKLNPHPGNAKHGILYA